MSISEHFRYRNDVFQSDIFLSGIGIKDVDVGCRISPTLRSMSMPTYAGLQPLALIHLPTVGEERRLVANHHAGSICLLLLGVGYLVDWSTTVKFDPLADGWWG
jgi:hypothetical protein